MWCKLNMMSRAELDLNLVDINDIAILVETNLLLGGGSLDRVLGREYLVEFLKLRR